MIKISSLLLFINLAFADSVIDQNNSITDHELREMLFGDTASISTAQNIERKIKWIPSYTLESGIGFSDNPLYGPYTREEANFLENSLEGFFLIQTKPEYFSYLYLYGEGKIYEELTEHKTTSIYLGQFEHAYTPTGSKETYGFRLRHTFYDQGFDFSELGLPYSLSVQSNNSEMYAYLSNKFSDELTTVIEFSLGSENFREITDDNKDKGISVAVKGTPDFLNWTLETEYLQKKYKERSKRNWDAALISGGELETEKLNFSLTTEKEYDALPFENSRAKFMWSTLQDNGGGYYNYNKISLLLKQELLISSCEIELRIGGSKTKYDKRVTDSGKVFERRSLTNGLSITRKISKDLDVYFRWSREEDFSNSRGYEYFSNFLSTGIIWEI